MIDRRGYDNIEIPGNLDEVVQGAIAEGMARRRRNRNDLLSQTNRRTERTGSRIQTGIFYISGVKDSFFGMPCGENFMPGQATGNQIQSSHTPTSGGSFSSICFCLLFFSVKHVMPCRVYFGRLSQFTLNRSLSQGRVIRRHRLCRCECS